MRAAPLRSAMASAPLRVGIAGFGLAGATFHAPLIRATDGLDLVAVSTSRPVDDARIRIFADPEALVADPDLDLIVIAAPHAAHFPLAKAALRAGKHVVVDKPFALDTAEADALIALAAEREQVLSVFHNRRWDGDYLTVKRLLAEKRSGSLSLFEAHWDRFRPTIKQGWREVAADGAGLLNDLGPHLIDQALELFGLPEAVEADIAIQREGAAVDDYFALTLHYGRMRAVLSASTLIVAPRPRFAVHGDAASFVKYGLDPQEAMLKRGADPLDPNFGHEQAETFGILTSGDGNAETVVTERGRYVDFYAGVTAAILDGRPVPVDPGDARAGLAIIAAARRSAAEGRRLPLEL
jgi:scyllo-inositol 2-dehydrogenase (NADP+)